MTEKHKLRRILGVPFGVAVIVGGTVGVGILRSPGAVAEHLNSFWMIALVWVLGGVYSLLGANYMAELASSLPSAGGPYVYARRAFGDYGGFVVGWGDWLLNVLSLSYMCIVFGEYSAAVLSNDGASNQTIFAVAILSVITALNWIGVRAGSGTQQITSAVKAIALLGFVAVCFIYSGNGIAHQPNAVAETNSATSTFATLTAFVLAFQLVLGTYSGWFSSVYFAEEDVDPARNMSRSLFGGIAVIIVIYVLVNLALLYVLPLEQLAGSKFAAADAMTVIFGSRSGQIVTTLAILSIVGIINATVMMTPRTLYAFGRDGLLFDKSTAVNRGGTPHVALAMSVIPALIFVIVGTFEMLVAIAEFLAVSNTILLITSLFVLRRKEPDMARPFRAFAYPFAPALMLIAAVLIFVGYIISNPKNSLIGFVGLVATIPIFLLIKKKD